MPACFQSNCKKAPSLGRLKSVTQNSPSTERPWLTDFATIFAHMWYRDFPLQHALREKAQRADWTTHISLAVRSAADLMGLFTCFESGGKTDAILQDSNKKVVAALEWEWNALHKLGNEFGKLCDHCGKDDSNRPRFAGLIGYFREKSIHKGADQDDYESLSAEVLENYTKKWPPKAPPLLLVLVHYENAGRDEHFQTRKFKQMRFYQVAVHERALFREQPACPWDVVGSRWAKENAGSK
jgi:hypothetical protein